VYITERDRVLNYDNISGAYFWDWGLIAAVSYIGVSGESNSEFQVKYNPQQWANVDFVIYGEHQYNWSEEVSSYYLGFGLDLLQGFKASAKGYLYFNYNDIYFDKETGIRATYADDFYTYGRIDKYQLSGKFNPSGEFTWFVNYYANNDLPRFNVGVNYSYSWSK
jgi:hypothetical protein